MAARVSTNFCAKNFSFVRGIRSSACIGQRLPCPGVFCWRASLEKNKKRKNWEVRQKKGKDLTLPLVEKKLLGNFIDRCERASAPSLASGFSHSEYLYH